MNNYKFFILKTKFSYLLIFFCASFLNYAYSQEVNLKENWYFKTDPNQKGVEENWFGKAFSDSSWDKVNVPHLWDLHNEYANYKGKAWYRKEFTLNNVDINKRVFVELGEIGMSYTLYLDGKKVAYVLAGNYLEDFDVTDFLDIDKKHQITLEIDNSLVWGAYWGWGGIRRFVKITQRNSVFIDRQEIIAQLDLEKSTAKTQTAVFIKNNSTKNELINLSQIISLEGKDVAQSNKKSILIPAQSEIKVLLNQNITTKSLKLWHFDHPNLYESKLKLSIANYDLGVLNDRFGIRKIEIKAQQLYLNGEKIRLAGYNWVADDRATGSVLPAYRYKEDIDLMKAAGANLARLSHRPLPKDVMDYLDEVGILVFSEFNNWPQFMNSKSEEPKLFAQKLIRQNFNHPSIIGWSVGNENGNLKEFPDVNDYTKNIIAYIKKELDSTRLVAYVSNTADFQDNDAAQFGDIVLINKYGNYEKGVDELIKRYPDKAIFMSEYGGHTENLIYDTPNKSMFKSLMVDKLGDKSNLIGYSVWTFNDYRSGYQSPNLSTATPLHQNRQWGIIDVYRNKKRSFKQMQNFYAPIQNLEVITSIIKPDIYQSKILITPRNKQDIPAFTLQNYHLAWEVRDFSNFNLETGLINLLDIKPGDKTLQELVQWSSKKAAFLKISLVNPSGYSVKDTIIFLKVPNPPKIKTLLKGSNILRFIFETNAFATQHQAYYKVNNEIKTTPSTIDHYIDIDNLIIGKTYEIWLTAKNEFGESIPSEIFQFTPEAGFVGLPPIVWQTQPSSESFFTGYSYFYSDVHYKIRYGTSIDNPESWKMITTNNFGMANVSNLINDKQYYYQISRSAVLASSINQWSETIMVKPKNLEFKQDVILHGFAKQDDKLLVSFTPQKNAIGYELVCITNKGNISYKINKASVSFSILQLPKNIEVSEIKLQAIINYN